MLNRTCKLILKELQGRDTNPYWQFHYGLKADDDYVNDLYPLATNIGIDEKECAAAVCYLSSKGLVTYTEKFNSIDRISLTHEGIHMKEFRRNQICAFLVKSVLVPIVVAVAISIATNLLMRLWGWW